MPDNHVDSTLNTHSNQSVTPTIDANSMLRGLLANLSVEQIQSILPENLIVSDVEVVKTPSVYRQVENCVEYYTNEASEEDLLELKLRLADCGLFGVEKRHLSDALRFGALSLADALTAIEVHCNHLVNTGAVWDTDNQNEIQSLARCIAKLGDERLKSGGRCLDENGLPTEDPAYTIHNPEMIKSINDVLNLLSKIPIVTSVDLCSMSPCDQFGNVNGLTECLISIDIPTVDIQTERDEKVVVSGIDLQKHVDMLLAGGTFDGICHFEPYLPVDILGCMNVDCIQDFLSEDHDKLIFDSNSDVADYLKEEDYLVFECNVEAKDHLESDSEFLVFEDVDEAKQYLQENEGLTLYDSDDVDTLVGECLTVLEEKIREQLD